MRDAVGQRRVDGVLGHVALGAEVVVMPVVLGQRPPLQLHLVSRLPGTADHFAHASHGLGVRGDHAEGSQVVQDVFGGDGLAADTRLGEGHVLLDVGVQVVAHHQHVQVLVDGVHGVGTRGVGGRGQYVGLSARLDDVGSVPTSGALGVIGVDRAALERSQRVLHEAGLVEGVGVDGHLDVMGLCDSEAVVDGRRRGAPVLVQLEPHGSGIHLLVQGVGQAGVPLAQEAQVHGEGFRRL